MRHHIKFIETGISKTGFIVEHNLPQDYFTRTNIETGSIWWPYTPLDIFKRVVGILSPRAANGLVVDYKFTDQIFRFYFRTTPDGEFSKGFEDYDRILEILGKEEWPSTTTQ